MNKKKIFNDPIYGLIRFPYEILYDIIDHPYFQRLRRISQQALSHYVYPGALHTRFQHALGALHLMTRALDILKSKGVLISEEEYEAACIAILLHDVGHGPFSHSLEHTLADIHHEDISVLVIEKIGLELGKDFSLVLKIFKGEYNRPFLNQLISGQVDIDRLDYLTRDSFFSGVAEGIIGYDRIITMMNVVDDELVIEEKGLFSLEKFLMARRLMYWQVYLHKTVVSAEVMLISILKRAKFLVQQHIDIPSSEELNFFLSMNVEDSKWMDKDVFLNNYLLLDDMDILWTIKKSVRHEDFIMRFLCKNLLERKLFKISLLLENQSSIDFSEVKRNFGSKFNIKEPELFYFFSEKSETITIYDSLKSEIKILLKSGKTVLFSDLLNNYKNITPESKVFYFYPSF
ncbi:MAG: HD domain-containing protein [Saprospiraceae bacterium]|nr:HD domain-containing protein [Saprospiraceae bacterium]